MAPFGRGLALMNPQQCCLRDAGTCTCVECQMEEVCANTRAANESLSASLERLVGALKLISPETADKIMPVYLRECKRREKENAVFFARIDAFVNSNTSSDSKTD